MRPARPPTRLRGCRRRETSAPGVERVGSRPPDRAVVADAVVQARRWNAPVGADHVAPASRSDPGIVAVLCRNGWPAPARDRLKMRRVREHEPCVVGGVQRADLMSRIAHRVDAGPDLARWPPPPPAGRTAGARPPGRAISASCAKLFECPWIAYDASVNGAPANPMSALVPPARLHRRMASSTWPATRAGRSASAHRCPARWRSDVRSAALRRRRSRTAGPSARAAAADRKNDRRVHLDAAHRLQRDLGGEVGRPADLEQGIAPAAPGYSLYRPARRMNYRRRIDGLAAIGPEEAESTRQSGLTAGGQLAGHDEPSSGGF
jgi:hypothetical protein